MVDERNGPHLIYYNHKSLFLGIPRHELTYNSCNCFKQIKWCIWKCILCQRMVHSSVEIVKHYRISACKLLKFITDLGTINMDFMSLYIREKNLRLMLRLVLNKPRYIIYIIYHWICVLLIWKSSLDAKLHFDTFADIPVAPLSIRVA